MSRDIAPALDYLDPELEARIFEASAAERPPCEHRDGCHRLAAWRLTVMPCRCLSRVFCEPHAAKEAAIIAAWLAMGRGFGCVGCGGPAIGEWTRL